MKMRVIILSFFLLSLLGCGFHLRGDYPLPQEFRIIRILPDNAYDPLFVHLRYSLKNAGARILIAPCETEQPALLTVLSQGFTERTTAYGPDVQINRATLQFTLTYQITDANGKMLIPPSTIQVERELTVNPNAVLGTEFERQRVKDELYNDATLQLIRQISMYHANPC